MPLGVPKLVRAAMLGLVALGVAVPPLYGQQALFDWEGTVRRLAAIEERDPYRLRDVIDNGRPTLIAFLDHLCYTCLRSVKPVEELSRRFSGRANVVVIDPSRITAPHTWAKDHYRVWFVPKFVFVSKGGEVAREYFGPTPTWTLASDLQTLLAQ
ncbi:MAG: hypothetical protein ACE5MG_14075 [Candidatus Methylomirabilales bacterium]